MRTICLYFEIHQIIHLKRYRFFDIGADHYYYDDYANETGINEVAERSYIPALNAFDIEMDTEVDISPIIKNEEQYEYWLDTLPFYKNIHEEGVIVNG